MMNRRMIDQYMLRLPPGWRDVIKMEAKKEHRTMNAEIIAAIETAMRIKGVKLDAES
ncbi:Arc family DNA-binding protein [Pontibaca salina]|uniref:Arc family DNA-binding protein n=1 Tax=Pontibaca salina TaxID=2795731 RepID=A0A934HPR1_9RHOB|nr:Arc family DNA-binding protein [Pontibaca salina]MBI6628320.1 Arc family DNA-binding protein [Pontibaca salina]